MSKKLMAIVLALVMCLTMLPVTAMATQDPITYVKRSWNVETKKVDVSDNETTTEYTSVTSGDTAWSAGFHVVQGDVTIEGNVTLSGDVNLILCDEAKVTVNGMITDEEKGYDLTIYGQTNDSGELNVTYTEGTNIRAIAVKNLTVSGGTVSATVEGENTEVKGIYTESGKIVVFGGTLSAKASSKDADGIYASAMEVNGGSVIAEGIGDESGRGIFVEGDDGLKITGGSVIAKGTAYTVEPGAGGKGIFSGGSISITGGCVVAKGSSAAMKLVGGGVLTLAQFAEIPTGTTLYLETDETNKYPYEDNMNSFDGSVTKFKESITDASTPAKSAVVEYHDAAPGSVTYVERSWNGTKVEKKDVIVAPGKDATALNSSSGATWNAGTYVVVRDTLIAGDIQIDGDVKLILCDGAKLTVLGMIRDYEVEADGSWDGTRIDGSSLTIYGQTDGSGELYVSEGENGGINVAKLTISGGSVVTADSIGAGDAGSITVLGGSVTAKSCGVAIDTNDMNVYGGSVIAEGLEGEYATGIYFYNALNICGGCVTAKAKNNVNWAGVGIYFGDVNALLNITGGSLVAAGSNKAMTEDSIPQVNGVAMASNTDIPEGVTIKTASNMDGVGAEDWDGTLDLNSDTYKYVSIVFAENEDEDDSGSALLRLVHTALVTAMTTRLLVHGTLDIVRLTARIAAFNMTLPVIIARWFRRF